MFLDPPTRRSNRERRKDNRNSYRLLKEHRKAGNFTRVLDLDMSTKLAARYINDGRSSSGNFVSYKRLKEAERRYMDVNRFYE